MHSVGLLAGKIRLPGGALTQRHERQARSQVYEQNASAHRQLPQCFAKIIALIDHLSPDTTATLSGPSLMFAPLRAMESSEASSNWPPLPDFHLHRRFAQIAGNAETAAFQHQPLRLFVEPHLNGVEVSIGQFAAAAAQADQVLVPLQQRGMRLLSSTQPNSTWSW